MRISDWSSDVCSSDLLSVVAGKVHYLVGGCMAFGNRLAVIAADDPDGLRSQRHPGNAGDGKRARSCTAANDTAAETHDTARRRDRKSTRLNPVTNAPLVCRLLLEKKKRINTT